MSQQEQNNSVPPASNLAGRKQIVVPTWGNYGPSLGQFLVVWAGSALMNTTILVGAYFLFTFLGVAGAQESEPVPVREHNEMADTSKEYDLTNTDLGTDDSIPLAYNVDRIEEVSVPGKVDPPAAVGIDKAPEAPPMNIPPPPGSGGGTGGALFDPNVSGTGAMFGTVGGQAGIYNGGGFAGRSGATREKMLREGGGNARSEQAVAVGLQFLALHQCADGRWSLNEFHRHARTAPLPAGKVQPDNSQPMTTMKNDTAGTAFGLLPFLAAGITNKAGKETPDRLQQGGGSGD